MTHSTATAPSATYSLETPSAHASASGGRMRQLHWCLRLGAAACFVGHGAFGIITKAAWVPYFGLVGIPSDLAYALMPVVGTVDILMGIAVLVSPRPAILLYMAVWAVWTALLRPFTGESFFETLERAGNYGVPFAMLLLLGWPRTLGGWFRAGDGIPAEPATLERVLRWTTAVLLFGHGALAAITGKALFATHYATLGMPGSVAPAIGWLEMLVAVAALFVRVPAFFIAIAVWKLATEALFPIAGAPIWEFIERAGSYAAPVGVALLLWGSGPNRRVGVWPPNRQSGSGPKPLIGVWPQIANWGLAPKTSKHPEGHHHDAHTARTRPCRERAR